MHPFFVVSIKCHSTVIIILFKFERALYASAYCYKYALNKASRLYIMHYVHKHKIFMQAPHTQSSLVIAFPSQSISIPCVFSDPKLSTDNQTGSGI